MQNRRNFLTRLSVLGGATLLGSKPVVSSAAVSASTTDEPGLCEKVKFAMLSMQRASWEQGTAIQAAVETNDLQIGRASCRERV